MNGLAQIDPAVEETVDMPEPPNLPAELPAPEESTPPEFSAAAEAPQGEQDGLASIFANPRDLYRYSLARANGASEQEALKVGDNGIGNWGDTTATYKVPMVGLPADTPGLEHGKLVRVTGPEGSVIAKVADIMPRTDQLEGQSNIDLNPAAAMAVGHKGGVVPVKWEFVSGSGDVKTDPHLSELPQPMSARSTTGPLGSIVPDLSDAKVIRTNPDGSVVFDKGVTMYPDMSIAVERGGNRFLRTADGRVQNLGAIHGGQQSPEGTAIESAAKKNVLRSNFPEGPEGDAQFNQAKSEVLNPAKPKIFRDTATGLAFDISNPQSPKPINLPGNPASVDLSGLKQGDWSSVPDDLRDVAQNIANYKYPPISGFALRSPYFQQMFKIISKVDPSFDYKNYQARQKYLSDFSGSGKIGQNILSFDTALDHMGRALEKSETMAEEEKKQGMTSPVRLKGYWASQSGISGDPRPNNYEADAHTLVNEYARAISGAVPTEGERASWDSKLIGGSLTYRNAEQRRQAMNEMAHNLGSRLGEIEQQYRRTMGKDLDVSLLSPEAESTLTKLGATDIVSRYGSKGGTKPYMDTSGGGSTVPFPGSDKSASATEHEIVEDEQGKRFVVSPDGKLIPYGQ